MQPDRCRCAEHDLEADVVGIKSYLQIWNPARWDGHAAIVDDEGVTIAQRLADLI